MAENGTDETEQLSPVLGRSRSDAMIIDESNECTSDDSRKIETPNEEEGTEMISNPTLELKPVDDISKPSNGLNGDTETSKPIDRHAAVDGCTESPKVDSQSSSERSPPVHHKSTISEPVLLHRHNTSPDQGILKSKLDFLSPEKENDGCKHCKELENMISLWELGVSGLTRNYSKILSQLNKVRAAATKLDGHLKEKIETTTPRSPAVIRNASVSGRKSVTVRQSMFEPGSTSLPPTNIAEKMYPQETSKASSTASGSTKLINDLNSHLSQAIDLCQQLAAANFKSNQRSSKQKLKRQVTVHSDLNDGSSNFRPALQSIAEGSFSSSYKKRTLERTPSAPGNMMNEYQDNSLPNGLEPKVTTDSKSKMIPDADTAVSNGIDKNPANQKPYHSHMMKLCSPDEVESEHSTEFSGESSSMSEEMQDCRLSTMSAFSDTDVKQIMSKIADLEEERMKLLTTIDDMQRDNNTVRLSLSEILGDLENKDLQLTLALQDLTIATGEIKRAAEMRKQLQGMESEHSDLLERLSNLEDESAAVKVSLIQLLQEKSATNKTLALENWRLNQRMKSGTLRRGSSATEGDNVSVISGFSSLTEDATLQEAYMGADDVASFVHKQGFLVKQGGRRKNWKKRLFVLSPEGLSYYKTEQPLQILQLENIAKIQICHGTSLPHPNMFEVHTPGRVFLLSAPTEDDMQSWVGMLQTLKQYNKGTTLNREASAKRANTAGGASALSPAELANAQSDSDAEPDHRIIHQSIGSEGRGPPTLELADSSEDEMLQMHTDHFGSRREDEIGGSPMSVPTTNALDMAANFDHPSPKLLVRLRSDSCS